ncbi:MAG: hypothetical protein ABIR05_02015 [Luteimonas sp.]
MPLPPLEWIPRIVAHGRRLARRASVRAASPAIARGGFDIAWLQVDCRATADRECQLRLATLAAQLVLARKLLREGGKTWLDVDQTWIQHARALLDAIHGAEAFAAQVAWRPMPRMRRIVLAFHKHGRDDNYIQQRFPNVEATSGRRYWLDLATWRIDPSQLQRMRAEGQVVTSKAGVAYIKRYFIEPASKHTATDQPTRLGRDDLPAQPTLAQILRHACPPGGAIAGFSPHPVAFARLASELGLHCTSLGSEP